MTDLLQSELIKLRTTRTFAALAGVAVATSVLIAGLTALLSEPTKASVIADVYNSDTSSLFILLLAIVGISGEWRHRTITSSLLAAPRRARFLAAKTLAFAAAGVVLSLAISLAVAALATAILSSRDLPLADVGDLLAQVGRNALLAALLGALGVGVGALVRNQPTAIVTVLLLSFAIEPAVISLVPEYARFGPFVALPLGVQDVGGGAFGFDELDVLGPGPALLAMLAWIGAAFAAAAILLKRRDVE
jgi:ABC-2 type transport system permease protein